MSDMPLVKISSKANVRYKSGTESINRGLVSMMHSLLDSDLVFRACAASYMILISVITSLHWLVCLFNSVAFMTQEHIFAFYVMISVMMTKYRFFMIKHNVMGHIIFILVQLK